MCKWWTKRLKLPNKCIYIEFLLVSFGLDCCFGQCEYVAFGFATLKSRVFVDLTGSFVSWCPPERKTYEF